MAAAGGIEAGARRLATLLREPADAASVHLTKFADATYNPTGLAWTGMCVDTSTFMAARMAGADARSLAVGARTPQDLLLGIRRLALGSDAEVAARGLQDGVSIGERARALAALGVRSHHTHDVDELFAAARAGKPVIWNGWAGGADTWHARLGAELVAPDGHHAVAVSRDPRSGQLLVSDGNSRIGPIPVSEEELRAFSRTPPVGFPVGGTILEPARRDARRAATAR